jgi:enterochelin esterase-like enzyme
MHSTNISGILVENHLLKSVWLQREVRFDCYLPHPVADPSGMSLLLINDGQNMEELGLEAMLEKSYTARAIAPLFCVAIHAGEERKMEYGVAGKPDYLGRGNKATAYTSFIKEELLPFISKQYRVGSFREKAFAGFSLGGLSALDIVWNNPSEFTKAGIFSGSLWWRDIDQSDEEYDDDKHRIMHQQIRKSNYRPGLSFFFQCGNKDETKDRNQNGIIDSIDDTLDMISELEKKGYDKQKDIYYLEMPEGKHDISTWALAMPVFLQWGWGMPASL